MTPQHLPSISEQEMNVACAEELGWTEVQHFEGVGVKGRDPKTGCPEHTPSFTTSADACLLLVRHMAEQHRKGFACSCTPSGEWWARFASSSFTDPLIDAAGKSQMEAIVRAFLLATGRAQN